MTTQKLQKGFIQQALPGILSIVLLIAIVIFLFTYLKLPSSPSGVSVRPPQEIYEDFVGPLIEQTEDAYGKLSADLPYQDPDGNFTLRYFSGPKTFSVDTQARTWQEYAERRRKAADFFRNKGIDPCKVSVIWGADSVLLTIPMPDGLDFGCPLNI